MNKCNYITVLMYVYSVVCNRCMLVVLRAELLVFKIASFIQLPAAYVVSSFKYALPIIL